MKKDPAIKYLWGHQQQILETYHNEHVDAKHLAIELPTGSGKTLVGLLIGEYRRRTFNEQVVFLCPTIQLCTQVATQAQSYGVNTSLLVGRQRDYDPDSFTSYQRGKSIAVTTYSGVFNTNPKIDSPSTIICDDAHAAADYISSLWTVTVDVRLHPQLFEALYQLLSPIIPENVAYAMREGPAQSDVVDIVSTIACHAQFGNLRRVLDESTAAFAELKNPWSMIKDHLDACTIYCTSRKIEIRPIIPPTATHATFNNANQHIYMSATLGEDGDLERSFGIKRIARLPIPAGWDQIGTGRRLILFPDLSTLESDPLETALAIIKDVKRALVLVPDEKTAATFKEKFPADVAVLTAKDVEAGLQSFTGHAGPVALIVKNRYDGMDLPGDTCRAMVLQGLPTAIGLQEKFIQQRLGAYSLLRDRVRTRITQAMGRCTRDESDYSIVILLGEDLLKWLSTTSNTSGIHPEIQAEIEFGLDNSLERSTDEMLSICKAFLMQGEDWDIAEETIKSIRDGLLKVKDATADTLSSSSQFEIDYLYRLWNGQYSDAFSFAKKTVEALAGGTQLKPYRSFWHYQAAVSSFLAWKLNKAEAMRYAVIENLKLASSTSIGLKWLNKLQAGIDNGEATATTAVLPYQEWFGQVDALLQEWKLTGKTYENKLADVKIGVEGVGAVAFEENFYWLGRLLGATAHKWEEEGAPDGLWVFGDWQAFVFEFKTEEIPERAISLDTVRQTVTHEDRARADKLIPPNVPCTTILVTRRQTIHTLVQPHLKDLFYLAHGDVLELFRRASASYQQVRAIAPGVPEEILLERAINLYEENDADMQSVKNFLTRTLLAALPVHQAAP